MHAVAVTESGEVFNINLEQKVTAILLPMPQPIAEVVCGKEHVLILSNSGQVFSYGVGSKGQLGHGTIENLGKPSLLDALDGIKIIAIAAGGWHSAAISNDGDLYMWGWNESGQLGFPCSELQSDKLPLTEIETVCCLPKSIEFKDDLKVIAVSCGSRHTVAITENNRVWTWGWNNYGQLGHKKCMLSDKPEVVPLPDNFVIQTVKSAFWSTLITGFIKENYK
ncbi:RCC1 domain-containing protein 1-like isoform X2 [Stegodyphus dumicola]|nr:RCC1 domain-containing protein 1-like isoform X2 [Stegodyphus dumicola]